VTAATLSPIFRESILRRFEKPEHQATVRAWEQILKDLIVEGDAVLQGGIAPREHWRLDAAGALGDLKQAQEELAMVASLMEDSGHQGADGARLLVALSDAATAVESIIAGLETAIARFVAGAAQ
jgi:hypothetical protein